MAPSSNPAQRWNYLNIWVGGGGSQCQNTQEYVELLRATHSYYPTLLITVWRDPWGRWGSWLCRTDGPLLAESVWGRFAGDSVFTASSADNNEPKDEMSASENEQRQEVKEMKPISAVGEYVKDLKTV